MRIPRKGKRREFFVYFRVNLPDLRFTALARGASVRVKPCYKIKKMSSDFGKAMGKGYAKSL
jgi:hypothetical protein